MPRKRTVEQIAAQEGKAQEGEQESKPRSGGPGPPRGKPQVKKAPKRGARRPEKSQNKQHPTVAETIKRNQQIVIYRDVEFLTFTQIAAKVGVSERTAREGYDMYVKDIAPLITAEDAIEKAGGYLRKLESVQAALGEMIRTTKSEQIRLRALADLVEVMWKEMTLRQHLGLMPKELGTLRVVGEIRWVADQVVLLLQKYEAPPEAFQELHAVMTGNRDN